MNRERGLLWIFDATLVLKIIHGALEIIAAVVALLISPQFVLNVAAFVTGNELAQDPDDFIANAIRASAQSFAVHTHYFLAFYLAFHGTIKLLLAVGIFAGKRGAYLPLMFSLLVFGGYEAYRGFARQELLLYGLALFDFSLLVLTAHEYRLRYPLPVSPSDTRGDYAGR